MALTKLDAVNVLLRKLGGRPVNSLDSAHPRVPAAVALIDRHTTKLQARAWWFNVENPTLSPQVGNKRIVIPGDVVAIDTATKNPRVAPRGGFLYNLDASTYEFDDPVKVIMQRVVPFDDLPHHAAEAVLSRAVIEWLTDNDGDDVKLRVATSEAQSAWSELHAEHIRSQKRNLLFRPSMLRRMTYIRGDSPHHQEF